MKCGCCDVEISGLMGEHTAADCNGNLRDQLTADQAPALAERERREAAERKAESNKKAADWFREGLSEAAQERDAANGEAIELRSQLASRDATIARLRAAFEQYEDAIDTAQRHYHNCQEWTDEEIGPIDAARGAFYDAIREMGTP